MRKIRFKFLERVLAFNKSAVVGGGEGKVKGSTIGGGERTCEKSPQLEEIFRFIKK